jgi:hypothetical protein
VEGASGHEPLSASHGFEADAAISATGIPMIGQVGISALGSSVVESDRGIGMASTPGFLNSVLQNNMTILLNELSNYVIKRTVTCDTDIALNFDREVSLDASVKEKGNDKSVEDGTNDLQSLMGIASSMKMKGKSSISFQSSSSHTKTHLSLSLIESSSNVIVPPTLEEVIAFGGIAKASTGVRSGSRLEGQLDVDMLQMDKARSQAQFREASCSSGKPSAPNFSIMNIPDEEIVH